tara:strand:- start:2367 stop:2708 length:342 start_codon:yes stop_codon:yes gene_type:complete
MAFKMKGFEPHNMYKTKKANTHKNHLALEKKGYDHNPYKKASSFTKTVDPVIGGDSKLYTKNKETILKNGLKDVQIQKYNEVLRNPDDYEDITIKTVKDNLKFHKQYLENKNK